MTGESLDGTNRIIWNVIFHKRIRISLLLIREKIKRYSRKIYRNDSGRQEVQQAAVL